jgi:CBS domain-containing protein
MRARDMMTSPVITVGPEAPVKEVAALMTAHGFTAMPVVDEEQQLLGIVTEADLMRDRICPDPRSPSLEGQPTELPPMAVSAVMTCPVTTMTPGADAADLARAMLEEHIRSIPIVEGSRVVGIVSRRDMLRIIARDDNSIAADVRRRLAAYGGSRRWQVSVTDGVVTVCDEFDDEVERHVVTVLARSVPGVLRVKAMHGQTSVSRGER